MFFGKIAGFIIMADGDRVGFIGQEVCQDHFPAQIQVADVRSNRSAVKGVPQVDHENDQDDHQDGGSRSDHLGSDNLGSPGKNDGRHGLRSRDRYIWRPWQVRQISSRMGPLQAGWVLRPERRARIHAAAR